MNPSGFSHARNHRSITIIFVGNLVTRLQRFFSGMPEGYFSYKLSFCKTVVGVFRCYRKTHDLTSQAPERILGAVRDHRPPLEKSWLATLQKGVSRALRGCYGALSPDTGMQIKGWGDFPKDGRPGKQRRQTEGKVLKTHRKARRREAKHLPT